MSEPPLQHSNSDDGWGQYDTEAETDVNNQDDTPVSKPRIGDPSTSTEDLLKESTKSDDVHGTSTVENAASKVPPTLSKSEAELFEKMHKSPEPIPSTKQQHSYNQNKKSSSPSKGMSNNHSSGGLRGGMHSSPSFKELEMAIGQQLALGMSSEFSSNNLSDPGMGVYGAGTKGGMRRKHSNNSLNMISRSSPGASPRDRSRFNNRENRDIVASSRQELDPFIHEAESRALMLLHSPNVNPAVISEACQKHGVLYYLRPEFHTRGVTFLSYFDHETECWAILPL